MRIEWQTIIWLRGSQFLASSPAVPRAVSEFFLMKKFWTMLGY